jgi:hypothetical protein
VEVVLVHRIHDSLDSLGSRYVGSGWRCEGCQERGGSTSLSPVPVRSTERLSYSAEGCLICGTGEFACDLNGSGHESLLVKRHVRSVPSSEEVGDVSAVSWALGIGRASDTVVFSLWSAMDTFELSFTASLNAARHTDPLTDTTRESWSELAVACAGQREDKCAIGSCC